MHIRARQKNPRPPRRATMKWVNERKRKMTWTIHQRSGNVEFCSPRRKRTNLKDGFDNSGIYPLLNASSLRGSSTWVQRRWKFGFRIIDISTRSRALKKELWMKGLLCSHRELYRFQCLCEMANRVMAARSIILDIYDTILQTFTISLLQLHLTLLQAIHIGTGSVNI